MDTAGEEDVDEATRQTQRAMDLARRVNLETRLTRFEIDEATLTNLRLFTPTVLSHIDRVVIRFYEYLDRFAEARDILRGHDIDRLRQQQKRHWLRLLAGDFAGDYVSSTLMIGLAHFHARVPPHVYIASYSFFMGELLRIASESSIGYEFKAISLSVNKVIMLDMSIVLNAYMLDSFAAHTGPDPEGRPA